MWISVLISLTVVIIGIYLVNTDISKIVSHCMGGSSSHTTMAAPVIVQATAKHTATVIFLHGLGDTGHGWAEAFRMIRQSHVKYVCPTANAIPVTLNGGFRMPSWFDIKSLDAGSAEDEVGIKAASKILQGLISEEAKAGISPSRIVIGGFSQGGAVALYSSLAEAEFTVAGVLALSTWLPLHKTIAIKNNQKTPVFQGHGEDDPMVNLMLGQMTAAKLTELNKDHKLKTYPGMGHTSCDQEMKDVQAFLNRMLPAV